MMLVVGVDLIHLFPQLLDSYHDEHGVVQLHHCFFSGRTVACGNRTYPLAPKAIKNILSRLESTTGFFGTIYEITEDSQSEPDDRCVTLLSAAISSAPAVPAVIPIARAAPPELNLHPEEEVETWDQVKPTEGSDFEMSESERSKAIVAEDRKYIFHGVVPLAFKLGWREEPPPNYSPGIV